MNKHIITCLFVVCALFYVQAQEIEPELPDSTEQVVYDPLPTLEPFTQAELDSIMVEARNVKFVQENFSETPVLTSVGPTINENNLVGEIPIQYSHDKNGGVNYTVPLEVHPGRSGMQPGLSLAYNSMRGNSILGYGWGLAGLSAITPTNNTIYYNGKTSPVTLTQDDAFVLDGMQLIRTGTLSYETVQGNIKVQGYGSNNIVKYFRATTSDGKRMTYGYTSNTTAECQYPLTEIKDINGNYITYTYDQIGNIYYVSQISYGGNTSTSNTSGHFAFIRFNYKQRPDNYAIYIGGKKIEETRLIESISTYYGETLLRTYSPVYGTTDVSMLQQIKCEAGGKQLNPLSFDYWKDEQVGKYIENGPIIIRQPTPSKPSLFYCRAKFDATSPNDGLIGYYNIGTYGRTSENRNINGYYGSTYPADYPIFIYPELSDSVVSPVKFNAGDGFQLFSPADIDGDNNQELVKVNYILNRYNDDENAKIQVSTYRKDGSIIGSKTFVVKGAFSVFGNIGSISLIERKFFIGDFDGDGKEELLSVSVSDSPTAFGKRSYSIVELIRLDNLTMICSNQQLNTTSIRTKNYIFPMDYDGDGKLDLCNIHPGGLTIYSFDTSMQLSSIYSGTELTSDENPQKAKEFLLGDINGDGKTDILYYIIDHTPNVPKMFSDWICLYSKGKGGFEETHTGIQQYGKRILQDVNNDGLPDLIFNESSLLTYLNKNGTFGSRDLYMNNTGARYTEGDFMVIPATLSRNNYQSSLICIGNNNVIWSFAYNRDNTRNRMLTETTNSFGVKNYHSYKQLDAPDSNYHSETQASGYPYTNLFGKMHLIEYTETYDPGGAADTDPGMTSRIWYNYYDGVIHKQGLGFCGFKKVEVSDEVKRKKYTQIFDPYKYGLPVSEDSPEATVNYSYTFKPNTGKILRLDKTTNEVYNKLTGTTHSSEVNYDNYGNAVSEIADYGSGFKTRIDREFLSSTSNEAANCTNLPRKELMRKYIGTKSSSTSTMRYYSSGNLSRIQSYYDTLLVKEQEFIRDSGCKDNILTSKEKNYNAGEDRWLASNFEYDSKGRLTKQIDPLGLSTYYTYDPVYGRPESTKNHKNKITSYLYDELGRLVQTTYPDDTYRKMTFEWSKNIAEGSRFPHIGSEDISYSHQLSEGGKVVACKQITLQPGFSFEASTGNSLSMEINKDECLYIQPYGFLTYVVTEEATGSPTVKKYMDVFNREMRTSQMSFDGNYLNTDTEYDSNGRVSKKSQPFKTGSEPRWNSYTYDNYDRPSKITYYSGKSDEFRYNGDEVTSIASGITSTKKYNSAGQLVQVRDTAGTIAYNYRPDGQPESIVAPGGITTSFEYDNYGRKVKLIDPSAGTQTYAYDEEGRLISEAEGEGREIIYTYDNFNRITSKVRDEYDTQYLYDNEGRLGAEVSNGYSLSRRYTYDQFDRVAWVIETSYDGKSVKEIFTYGNGQLQSTQYESNAIRIAKEEYIYTHGHHTETILNGVGSIFKLKAEDESGRTTQIETGKLTRNYGYDMYGLPTSHLVLLTSGTTLYDQRYEFDVLTGNLKYRKDAKRNITESFGYDHLNRLTTLNGDTYVSYDDKGNITYRAGIGYFEYNHPSKPYAVTDLIQTNNVVPSGNQEITYTSTRRFATISENGYFAQFQYDSSDDRTKMQVTHNEQDYLTRYYIGSRYEKDITPMHTKEKLYLGGDAYSAPAVYVKEDDGEWTLHYLLRDYLGSIAQVTDSNGVLVQELSYDPWGRLRNPNTHEYYASGTEPELFLGRGYTGHEHLAMFGLINMNARLYDPITGRFLSPDPYVQAPDFSQNHNRYSYGLNNPLVFSDPSGEFIFTILSGLFCPVLMPVAMGIDMGLISGGMRGIMTPGMNFWDGAWRGGLVGVVGGGLSMFGGGSFLSNVSLGMLGGAITGGLDAALWGNDIGKGIFQGAAIGGVMALIQSTSQSIENYREYGIFDTNDGTFNKLVNDAFIENPTTRSYSIDEIGAQRALDFWQARNGGPTLTYAPGQTNGKTDVYGNIKIGEGAFVGGHRAVRQQISHEMGHYIHNVNWDNGIVGGTVSDPGFINVDATYGGDGIYGYNHAIKSTGKYHTGFKMISQETYRRPGTLWKISNPYRNDAWKSYDLRKWLYLLPRRF